VSTMSRVQGRVTRSRSTLSTGRRTGANGSTRTSVRMIGRYWSNCRRLESNCRTGSSVATDRGGMTAFQASRSLQPARQVNAVVQRRRKGGHMGLFNSRRSEAPRQTEPTGKIPISQVDLSKRYDVYYTDIGHDRLYENVRFVGIRTFERITDFSSG